MSTATLSTESATRSDALPVTALRRIGGLGILAGVVLIAAGIIVWIAITVQLSAEQIIVSDDAAYLAGTPVNNPVAAFAQADIINHHALEASGGLTYAQLEQDDPIRATVMNASFLRASLFTSVVSYGVALFAAGMGLMLGLFGWSIRALVPAKARASA